MDVPFVFYAFLMQLYPICGIKRISLLPASRNDPGGDGNGITADGAAKITGYGCSFF